MLNGNFCGLGGQKEKITGKKSENRRKGVYLRRRARLDNFHNSIHKVPTMAAKAQKRM